MDARPGTPVAAEVTVNGQEDAVDDSKTDQPDDETQGACGGENTKPATDYVSKSGRRYARQVFGIQF